MDCGDFMLISIAVAHLAPVSKMEFPLVARNVTASRLIGGEANQTLDVSVDFERDAPIVIFGKPGCGKNLLLRLMGLMEAPDDGDVLINGESTRDWSEERRIALRSKHLGFVFESGFLLPSFTVIENVAMPLFKLTGAPAQEAQDLAEVTLEFAGMASFAHSPTHQLPVWAQLRVALARALITSPAALFVENVDGALSGDALASFLKLLGDVRREFGCPVLVTAASETAAQLGCRALEMQEGRIVRDWKPPSLLS